MTDRPDYRGILYVDEADEWRWRLLARNGNVVADSAEGYWNRTDCEEIFAKMHPGVTLTFDS